MKCAEVMTKDPACCGPEDTAQQAAMLMKKEDVGPIPVVSDSNSRKLVGIVSRADIVRAFTRPDAEIWEELRSDVFGHTLWLNPDELDIDVTGGAVKVAGKVESKTIAQLIEAFAWRIPGVVSVDCSGVTWHVDDRAGRISAMSQ